MPVRVAKNAALIKNCRCEKCGGKKKKKKQPLLPGVEVG